jgi:hypothetical protein
MRLTCTLLLSLLAALPARAEVFCAVDGGTLKSALDLAMLNTESDSIRLASGTFSHTDGFRITVAAGESIDIIGGWNAGVNPCTTLSPDASLSRIDGLDTNPGFYVHLAAGAGNALVANLTVERVTHATVPSAALYVGPQLWNTAYTGNVLVERVIVQDSRAYHAIFAGTQGEARVRGSLVVHNHVEHGISVGAFGNTGGTVVNSTVAHNVAGSSGADFIRAFRSVSGVASTFSNNILQQNTTGGVERDLSSAEFTDVWVNCIIGGMRYSLGNDSVGNFLAHKARFVAPELRDYRLAGDSVGINDGVASPQGGAPLVDLMGRLRPFGGALDLGAYETDVTFADSFE